MPSRSSIHLDPQGCSPAHLPLQVHRNTRERPEFTGRNALRKQLQSMSILRQGADHNDAMTDADVDADAAALFFRDEDASSSDGDTIKPEQDDVADILEDQRQSPVTQDPATGVNSVKSRYRELVEAAQQETTSDDGSTDTFPRRAASPSDSNVSIPDDSPSAQVLHNEGPPQVPLANS